MWIVFCVTLFGGLKIMGWLSQFEMWVSIVFLLIVMLIIYMLYAFCIEIDKIQKEDQNGKRK